MARRRHLLMHDGEGVLASLQGLSDLAAVYDLALARPQFTGNCVRLRRAADNAAADFGFAGGKLDIAAIQSWLANVPAVSADVNNGDFEDVGGGNATRLVAASTQYFHATNAALDTNAASYSFAAWVKVATKGANRYVGSLWNSGATDGNWRVYYRNDVDRFYAEISSGAALKTITTADVLGAPAVDTWYHLAWSWDNATKTFRFWVDGVLQGTQTDAGFSIRASMGYPLRLGAFITGNFLPFDGSYQCAGVWQGRALQQSDVTELYNAGTPLRGAQLSANLLTSCTAYWDLDSASTAASVGAISLTAVGAPGAATGKVPYLNWTAVSQGSSLVLTDTVNPRGGARDCRFIVDSSNSSAYIEVSNLVAGKTYNYAFWAKKISGAPSIQVRSGSTTHATHTPGAAYEQCSGQFVADASTFRLVASGATSEIVIDDVSLTAVEDGAFVTTWYDQSGNGRNVTQATASRQPQLILSDSLLRGPALSFDGLDDYLRVEGPTLSQPYTVYHAGYVPALAGAIRQIVTSGNDPSNPLQFGYSANGMWRGAMGGTTFLPSAADTLPHAHALVGADPVTEYWLDGVRAGGLMGANPFKPITIGADFATTPTTFTSYRGASVVVASVRHSPGIVRSIQRLLRRWL